MTDCNRFEMEIAEIIAGDGMESAELRAHLDDCADCRAILDMHGDFELFDTGGNQVTEDDFAGIRREVLRQINNPSHSGNENVIPLRKRGWLPATAALAAAIFVGFIAGGYLIKPDLAEEIQRLAREDRAGNTPVRFTDVSFTPTRDGKVAASFNVSTYMETVGAKDDPLLKELMVQSLLASDTMNDRLEAIKLTEDVMDPRIREALVISLREDESLAVRLKAMSRLADEITHPEVHDAFVWVLRHEKEVPLRLQAIDYLSGQKTDPEQLQDLLEELQEENGSAIPLLIRARDAGIQ